MLDRMRAVWIIACVACSSAIAGPTENVLERDHPVEREIKRGEKHRYKIALRAGTVLTGVVDQRGIDLEVVTFDPSGKQLHSFDSPNGENGPEPFVIEARIGGAYHVEVRPFDLPPGTPPPPGIASQGKYEVKIDEVIDSKLYAERQMAAVIDSPRILELWKLVRDRRTAEVDRWWRELKGHAPIVEPYPGDPKDVLITFVFRSRMPYVGLVGGPSPREKPMLRVGDSDVWYLTARIPGGATIDYAFVPADGPTPYHRPFHKQRGPDPRWAGKQLDPNNPAQNFGVSTATLPGAAPRPWIVHTPGTPAGKITELAIESAQLKEKRRIGVYTPAGYDPRQRYPLVVAFDGEVYGLDVQQIPLPTILDNLIAAKKIPPLVAALVRSEGTRERDLACSEPFAAFIAGELVPRLRTDYRAGMTPGDTIVTGSSLGGLAASFIAFHHSDVVGKVLSNSGSYWFQPGALDSDISNLSEGVWLPRQFAVAPRLPIKFYLDAGIFEDSLLETNRRMRDVLTAKGYALTYAEFPGGHDYKMWSATISDGLIALTAK